VAAVAAVAAAVAAAAAAAATTAAATLLIRLAIPPVAVPATLLSLAIRLAVPPVAIRLSVPPVAVPPLGGGRVAPLALAASFGLSLALLPLWPQLPPNSPTPSLAHTLLRRRRHRGCWRRPPNTD
jgi:hypothetical protein